jgi:succinate dehydrogenase/fumarate reductase iron-sulfur protein
LGKKTVILKLFRFDPSTDSAPTYKSYELPYGDDTTVLDLLEHIHEHEEPFSFQRECKSFKCGSCTVNVNGIPVLACKQKINRITDRDPLVIEPLTCFPLIKDLMVDFTYDLQERREKRPFPEFSGDGGLSDIEGGNGNWELLREYFSCIRCAACMEICPVFEGNKGRFAGPLYLLDVARLFFDPRDEANRLVEGITEGIEFCDNCKKCNEVCPVGLDVFQMAVGRLRQKMKEK